MVIWEQRGEDVWLSIAADDAVTLHDLVAETDAVGYEEVDLEALTDALERRETRRVAVVGATRRAGSIAALLDEDGMRARLRIHPAGPLARSLAPEDARQVLADAGVVAGIDEDLLVRLPYDREGEHVVARGIEPEDGEDGRITYVVDTTHELKPLPRPDGGVDLHAAATIPKVRAGELLALVTAPTDGTPGTTVFGEELLPRRGRPAVVPPASNVTLTDDGSELVAAVDGLLERAPGRIAVRPDLTIDGDVDFQTGSIDFHGDVIVNGSVRPGFRVRAGGRVVVAGDVDQAVIEGGSLVWVRGAVVGDRCIVRSHGDVKVRTVHEGRIEARGSVFVEREASDATILASWDLVLVAPRNRLIGGSVWAGHEVVAGEIGAVSEITTRVTVGVDPFTAEEIQGLHAQRTTQTATLDRVRASVGRYVEEPDGLAELDPARRRAADRLLAAHAALVQRLEEIDQRLQLLQHREGDTGAPRVVARLALRPGVLLVIGEARRITDTARFRVSAVEVDGTVEVRPLEPAGGRTPLPAQAR